MKKQATFISGLFLFFSPLGATQQNFVKTSGVAASFLEVNQSIRRAGMGGDQVAASGDAEAIFSNPAALVNLEAAQFSLSQNQAFLDSKNYSFAFARPRERHTFGIGGFYRDEGSEEKVDVDSGGNPVTGIGNFRFSTMLLHGSFNSRWSDRFSTGVSLKGWQDKQADNGSNAFSADAGFFSRSLLPSLDLAGAVRNIGPNTQGKKLPTTYIAGGAYHLPVVSLYSQAEFAAHRDFGYRAGLEYKNDRFWLRGGYQSLTGDVDESIAHFTLGGGLRIKEWAIDYAWNPGGILGDQHWVGLKFGFGQTAEEKQNRARLVDQEMAQRMSAYASQAHQDAKKEIINGNLEEAQKQLAQSLAWNPENEAVRADLTSVESKLKQKKVLEEERLKKQLLSNSQLKEQLLQNENLKLRAKLEEASRAEGIVSREQVAKMNREAYTLFMLGQTDKAIKIWQKILIDEPENRDVRNALEQAQEKKKLVGELAQRKEGVSKIYELNAKALGAYTNGDLKQSAAIWRDALKMDAGNNAWIQSNLDRVEREMTK